MNYSGVIGHRNISGTIFFVWTVVNFGLLLGPPGVYISRVKGGSRGVLQGIKDFLVCL